MVFLKVVAESNLERSENLVGRAVQCMVVLFSLILFRFDFSESKS